MYVDDNLYFRYFKTDDDNYGKWPFENEQNVIINQVVGGNWGAILGIDDSIYPVNFRYNYFLKYYNY